MLLKGICFLITGFLLLGHIPALAEEYLRVCKNGVVYYYFPSRKTTSPMSTERIKSKPQGKAWSRGKAQRHTRPAASSKAPIPVKSAATLSAITPQVVPGPEQAMKGAADGLKLINPYDVKEMVGAPANYLMRMLAKCGFYSHPALPASEAGPHWIRSDQMVPAAREPEIGVPEAWVNLLKLARTRQPELAWGKTGLGLSLESSLPDHCFPVARPFTFRDTWGDYRSGGRTHQAVDIVAVEGTEVYAITAGVIQTMTTSPNGGITLLLLGKDGRGYGYMHLQGYAAGLVEGKAVKAGELIGYVGRTGLRESAAHLHLQAYADHRFCKEGLLNPYGFLVRLCQGIGVTDLDGRRLALSDDQIKINKIQVYRRPQPAVRKGRQGQMSARKSSIWVIRNF